MNGVPLVLLDVTDAVPVTTRLSRKRRGLHEPDDVGDLITRSWSSTGAATI